jgi:hypothetical protein
MNNTVNRPIKQEDLQVGDEVITRGLDLNYMEILRVPKKQKKTYKHWNTGIPTIYDCWSKGKCKRMNGSIFDNNSAWDKEVCFDFEHKTIWLVKRIGINK